MSRSCLAIPDPLSPKEEVLARVLSEPHHCGRVVVLSGRSVNKQETLARLDWAVRQFPCCRPELVPSVRHTQDEAIVILADHRPALPLTIVTSAYHQLRAFLTFLQVLPKPYEHMIFNQPCPSRMDLLPAELAKIDQYGHAGYLASYETALEYLDVRDGT